MNCGSVATELANEKCSFSHFRMDAHVGMKAETMVRALPKEVTKVYLLNQDYLFGQSVQRDVKAFLEKLRPDVKVVGDELIPLGKVKDFSPYVTKIKASGAQALLTGNWGPDMTLLIKSGMDAGLDIRYYTMYAHLGGGATAIGPAGKGLAPKLVAQVGELLNEIARCGVSILLVEQKLTIALAISRRVYVMGHGRIVFEGTPAELVANEAVRKERLEV